MRIPLDYYRILGVPTKATTAQITQAYDDRVAQLPPREHSDFAIQARKNIIEQAFQVLSQVDERNAYDRACQNQADKTQQPDSSSRIKLPLQIDETSALAKTEDNHTAIAIDPIDFLGSILLLLELGEYELILKSVPPYLNVKSHLVKKGDFGAPEIVRSELILCLALTYLELSREQWQQGQYGAAAESGHQGQSLLLDEGLFPSLRGEIQGDLDRLRPYQILELLASDLSEKETRAKGLKFLQTMLDARGGIDGKGDDRSGLSMDDFLRFIQQLRSYLTVSEQQDLFITESKRPSAVATYLAVYALVAEGFSQRQPSQIVQAKTMLLGLAKRRNVSLEQAICALLLGQTEEAAQALELSQDHEALAIIQDHSQDSPDLLPGLCFYCKNWLQDEVFPHFRDLDAESVSLKDYFADPQVQDYLEQLPVESHGAIAVSTSSNPDTSRQSLMAPVANLQVNRPTMPTSTEINNRVSRRNSVSEVTQRPVKRPSRIPPLPTALPLNPANSSPSLRSKRQGRSFPVKGVLIGLAALVILFGIVKAIAALIGGSSSSPADALQVSISGEPPIPIPSLEESQESTATPAAAELDEVVAGQVLEEWFESKAEAFGQEHQIESLQNILAEPLLSTWRNGAQNAKSAGTYRTYEHALKVTEVKFDPAQPTTGSVTAEVTENAKYYLPNGSLNEDRSYNSKLQVRYGLIRQNDRWLIKTVQVL